MNTTQIHLLSPTQESAPAMKFEASTTINAPAATVFALSANVAGWPVWDPDLKAASLAPLWSRLIGSGMKKTLPAAMAGLKRAAEAA